MTIFNFIRLERLNLFTFVFIFMAVGNSLEETSSHHTNLPALQAEKLARLFVEKNIGLQFEFIQNDNTESLLFSLTEAGAQDGAADRSIFRVTTSTVHNTINLEFNMRPRGERKIYKIGAPLNDNETHKVIVALSGDTLTVVDNCRQLLSTKDEGISFNHIVEVGRTRVYIGDSASNGDDIFHGRLSEFTASAGDPTSSQCAANLELLVDNSVVIETIKSGSTEKSAEAEKYSIEINEISNRPFDGKMTTRNTGVMRASRRLADEQSSFSDILRLTNRINHLEQRINHWSALYQKFDGRIKRVELYQRGCEIGGMLLSVGERHQNQINCTECQCTSSTELYCGPIGCPQLDCSHPIHVPGQCCPRCGESCYYNGQEHISGHSYWPKRCVKCMCDDGTMDCQFMHTEKCPVLDCPIQDTPPNECCPVCVNVDHCAPEVNPCDHNANCESTTFSAKCTCKMGFFGNGTICYDINECLWDESAREQLGGCQAGTICINLPGSFKCECLPGFQKLDDKRCLDVIKI